MIFVALFTLCLFWLDPSFVHADDCCSSPQVPVHAPVQPVASELIKKIKQMECAFPKETQSGQKIRNSSVFPEDGSLRVSHWYHGALLSTYLGASNDELKAALAKEGVMAKPLGEDYPWAQDISLFAEDGSLLVMAPMPADEDVLIGLTRGVYDSDDRMFRRLGGETASRLGLPSRTMKWTLVEGGEMISGRLKDGAPYAVLSRSVLERAKAFSKHLNGTESDDCWLRQKIGEDLGVPPENLFFVTTFAHLDTFMMALPGGKILLSDPTKTPGVIRQILSQPGLKKNERERLEKSLKLYEDGYSKKDNSGKELAHFYPADADSWNKRLLDEMETQVSKKLQVIRTAGILTEIISDTWNPMDITVNFFNGFLGKNANGKTFLFTNSAKELPSLEKYWKDWVAKNSEIDPTHIHFIGQFRHSSGLDCAGAPAR